MKIENIIDVRNYLKRFGTIIYTGSPQGDLEMMKDEILELFQSKIIDSADFAALMKAISAAEKDM